MPHEFVLPDIGEGLTEADIVGWLIEIGDEVAEGQPLCEVETAKAVVELPSPYAGILVHRGAEEGETIEVGQIVAVIGAPGETWSVPSGETTTRAPDQAAEPAAKAEQGTVRTVRAMPVVRRLAKERGVDLSQVTGTGPAGQITRHDVLAFAEGGTEESGETVPLSPTRRAIAEHLSRSWQEIPHVTTYDDVDASVLLAARKRMVKTRTTPVPLEALLVLATVPALKAHPEFNATLEGTDLTVHQRYDLGIAVDTPEGLLVPVLEGADGLGLDDLISGISALAEGARARTLTLDQMQGGTFTISNIGALGGGHGTPIIPLGTTAIVSFGRAADAPVVRDGAIEIVPVMPISLSYDHRVIDGALGRRFIDALVTAMTDPTTFEKA